MTCAWREPDAPPINLRRRDASRQRGYVRLCRGRPPTLRAAPDLSSTSSTTAAATSSPSTLSTGAYSSGGRTLFQKTQVTLVQLNNNSQINKFTVKIIFIMFSRRSPRHNIYSSCADYFKMLTRDGKKS